MLKKPLFIETFVLLATVGILNYAAIRFHLYWSANEFDSIVHFFGGASMSMLFLWLYFHSGLFRPEMRKLGKFVTVAFFGGMGIAVAWEVFELLLGEASMNKAQYPFDTSLDLIMDLLGASAACLYGYLKETKSQISNNKSQTIHNGQNPNVSNLVN